jgi:transcriptional regulator with XRE-family HTH domain
MNKAFVTWLIDEMEKRDWSNSTLARNAGLVPSAVSQVVSGDRSPGYKFCIKIAKPLELPPETVLRKADLLPRLPSPREVSDSTIQDMVDIIRNLPEDSQRDLLEIALALLRRQSSD